MESALFILNALVVVIAVVMSLRDERLGSGDQKTSFFRHSDAAVASGKALPRARSRRRDAASTAVGPLHAAIVEARGDAAVPRPNTGVRRAGTRSRRPTRKT